MNGSFLARVNNEMFCILLKSDVYFAHISTWTSDCHTGQGSTGVFILIPSHGHSKVTLCLCGSLCPLPLSSSLMELPLYARC